ncbi:unnamed protein product [Paramecium pentaurelia]|uniref:USP domain-containing protein n=1 Tax=Paramecium pentaurelia TaxID=43138 RepID=A0A8S1WYX4_9CILI|nr:unnamed protein product [Paramecium pentaurelia]
MSSIQFTPQQEEKIKQVCEFSSQTKEKVIYVLQGNNWQVEQAIDILTNAGAFISNINNTQSQQPNNTNKISQQNNLQNNNSLPTKQQQNNKNPSQNEKNDIQKIEEQIKLTDNQEWETSDITIAKNKMLQKSLNQNIGQELKRIYQLPVGLVNVRKIGYFNCIIQILVQNPAFLEKVLTWKKNQKSQNEKDKKISFIMEFQMLLRRLTFTNKRFLNHQEFVEQTFDIINFITKTKISDKNLKPNEFFEIFMKTLDPILSNTEYEENQSKNLLDNTLNAQFQMQQQSVNEITLNFKREDRYLYLSLLKLVCQDQFIMFQKIPQTFSFSLLQKQNNNSQIKVDYWFPLTINLQFLTNEKMCQQLKSILLNLVTDKTIQEINSKQKLLNSLIIVEQSYEQNKIIPINVLEQLRIERKKLQNELQKYFLLNDGLNQTEYHQDYYYYLHAAVIQIEKDNLQHFYVYIYNFTLKQWYRYNDTDVRVESDEIVRKDIQQNGCFFVYVSQNQMRCIKHHQEKQFQISTNLELEQGIINWNQLEINQLMKPLIPKEIKKIIESENENNKIQ